MSELFDSNYLLHTKKRCAQCGQLESLLFFGVHSGRDASLPKTRKSICFGCQQRNRDQEKGVNRLPTKMRDTRRRHAKRLGFSVAILEQQYGWGLDRMEHDAAHAYSNGCPYCYRPFCEMKHGYSDLTLDIVNPSDPPYYRTNVRWVCMTCNREKSMTPSTLWAAKLACWDRYQERLKETHSAPAAKPLQQKLF